MMATKMCGQSGNIFCFSDLSLLNTCSFLWLTGSSLHEEVNIHMSLSYIMNKICVQACYSIIEDYANKAVHVCCINNTKLT